MKRKKNTTFNHHNPPPGGLITRRCKTSAVMLWSVRGGFSLFGIWQTFLSAVLRVHTCFTSGPFRPGRRSCFEAAGSLGSVKPCTLCCIYAFRSQVSAAERRRLQRCKAVLWWLDGHKEIKATLYGHGRWRKSFFLKFRSEYKVQDPRIFGLFRKSPPCEVDGSEAAG